MPISITVHPLCHSDTFAQVHAPITDTYHVSYPIFLLYFSYLILSTTSAGFVNIYDGVTQTLIPEGYEPYTQTLLRPGLLTCPFIITIEQRSTKKSVLAACHTHLHLPHCVKAALLPPDNQGLLHLPRW